jgi:hypothetical protein
MGQYEIKKLLYNKRNVFYIEEASHRMGEKSFPGIHQTRD